MSGKDSDLKSVDGCSDDNHESEMRDVSDGILNDEQRNRRASLKRLGKFSTYAIPAALALSSKKGVAAPSGPG